MNQYSQLTKKNNGMIYAMFIIYISCYGTLSIFYDNTVFKISKEVIFVLLLLYSLNYLFLLNTKKDNKSTLDIFLILSTILLINYFLNNNQLSIYTFFYGIKITILPILSIFLGMYIQLRKINIVKPLIAVWIILICTWLFQKYKGLDYLLNTGFKYGINVKHFFSDTLRLPSTVGTPDNYAFLLALVSCYLIYYTLEKKMYKSFAFYFLLSLFFIFLSTIRSALLFYCIFLVLYLIRVIYVLNKKYVYSFFLCSIIIFVLLLITLPINPLFSLSSSQERLENWSSTITPLFSIEGFVGNGLGTVGAANTTINLNNFDVKGNAVDNQYLALYEQIGLVGMTLFLLLFVKIINFSKNIYKKKLTTPLIVAFLICSFFTNTLEVYPFNILFGLLIGSELRREKNERSFYKW